MACLMKPNMSIDDHRSTAMTFQSLLVAICSGPEALVSALIIYLILGSRLHTDHRERTVISKDLVRKHFQMWSKNSQTLGDAKNQ